MGKVNKNRDELPATRETRSYDGLVIGPGGQIGPFRIEQELGRGGAGVVYLAHDTKLDRCVAIKSVSAELMENPKVRSRFSREARLLASLNHPNIATIYEELKEAEGVSYLVLEYVPGQTLAERIAKTGFKLQESLSIALQIAEAVAAAHEHDVIHRDLKPRNIKITPEGKVKVLDFGLAKAVDSEAEDQESTVTDPGRVLGTPAYMSPEQARGKPIDKRSDIWSFGCVLYEMLTATIPFGGETISDTLANVLQTEPDWQSLPESTPANIRSLVRRCLEKDPRRRLRDIGDASIEISETQSGTIIESHVLSSPPPPPLVSRLSIPVPADKALLSGISPNCFLAISPDGTRLVCVGELDDGSTELYLRHMDGLEVKPIPGTRGAHNPFFSPDSQWVGFFTPDLKKVSLAGGEPLTLLADIPWGVCAFGSWADDGTIVFSAVGGGGGLQRISDDGGRPETLISSAAEEGKVLYAFPQVLPTGKAILYSHVSLVEMNLRGSRIEAFWPETGKRQTVLDNASYARYVRSGHLIFVRDHVPMAAPFDLEHLKISGPSTPLVDDVGFDWRGRTPQIAISHNGTVVYVLGSEFRNNELVWVDRQGVSQPLGAPAQVYENPRLSPDGRLIAVTIRSQEKFTTQVHVYNIQRGTLTQLTTEGENMCAQWSPEPRRIALSSRRAEGAGVFCMTVGGSAPAELLVSEPSTGSSLLPYSWSHDKNLLACTVLDPNTQDDIWILDLAGENRAQSFLNSEYGEYNPAFSPDGRWLAYVSDESGRPEVYLREYIDEGRKELVSTEGGVNPAWSRNSRELYYINGKSMMVVKVTLDPDFTLSAPERLFEGSYVTLPGGNLWANYDVGDDERFLMLKKSGDADVQLICVHNWFEELKRRAPAGKNK